MFQPSGHLPGRSPFANILHSSNMLRPLPDPAWDLGLAARASLNGLREHLRLFALQASAMEAPQWKARLEDVMKRIIALLALSAEDDKDVLGDGEGHSEDTIGLTIAHQLHQILNHADDMIYCLNMLDGQDMADFAERAEIQIAALIHGHFVEQERADG